jgi:polysaccharide biosynthesis/export protein
MRKRILAPVTAAVIGALWTAAPSAQTQPVAAERVASQPAANTAAPVGVVPPAGYVIGAEDLLSVVFWNDKDMSAEIVVRPDGKISLPLLNEVQASGLTPDQLRQSVTNEAKRFMQDPKPTIIVRQINSRKVFITGAVEKPGTFMLNAPTTVLQLIATAGGLKEYADRKNIIVISREGDGQTSHKFNYSEVIAQKNVNQNIMLKPGDTVVVP